MACWTEVLALLTALPSSGCRIPAYSTITFEKGIKEEGRTGSANATWRTILHVGPFLELKLG